MNEKATAGNGTQGTVENIESAEKRVEEDLAVAPADASVVEDEVGAASAPTNGVGTVRVEGNGVGRGTGGSGDQRDVAETHHIDQRSLGHHAPPWFLARPYTAFSVPLMLLLVALALLAPTST